MTRFYSDLRARIYSLAVLQQLPESPGTMAAVAAFSDAVKRLR